MSVRKKDAAKAPILERASRNPRASRQSKTVGGNPILNVTHDFMAIRESLGMSQTQLAQAAGIPAAAIANVESGRYFLSARNGIQIFLALARTAPAGSELQRQANESARELAVKQKALYRKSRIAAEGQIESGKKKLKEIDAREAEIELAISKLGKV
jgi:transcriptional regulator with XRE-family HTH domain